MNAALAHLVSVRSAMVWTALVLVILLGTQTTSGASLSVAVSPQTIDASQMTVVTILASTSAGDLSVTTSAGTLTLDGGLTAPSCGGGTAACAGVTGSGTAQLTIPSTGNDLSVVILTFTAPVTPGGALLTASQGGVNANTSVTVRAGDSGTITSGSIPTDGGFGLVVFGGGTYDQLVSAAACPGQVSFWATNAGRFVLHLPGAPSAVNAPFESEFAGGVVPTGTPLIGQCLASSGIEGHVTLGPLTPVCAAGQPCDRPYQATLRIEDVGGAPVTQTTSGSDGHYRVALAPGRYTVIPLSPPGQILPRASSLQVDVLAAQFVTADIVYDTGIR